MGPEIIIAGSIVQALAPCLSVGCCTVAELVSRVLSMDYLIVFSYCITDYCFLFLFMRMVIAASAANEMIIMLSHISTSLLSPVSTFL